jgi:ubiquinone/menaquinone biosynthesis C-methylase UbiE
VGVEPERTDVQPQLSGQETIWRRFLRFGFRLLYRELAWTYDAVSWLVSLGAWRSWQLAAVPFVQGPRVLELAHGPGHLLLALHRAGFTVIGLDVSALMGRLAARRLGRNRTDVPLVRGRAQGLPFADEAFDTIVATFPAEFIAQPDTIASLHRCLGAGGRVVIVPEAQLTRGGLLARLIELLYAITGQRQAPADGQPPSRLWSEAWQRYGAAGFRLEYRPVELAGSRVFVIIATRPASRIGEILVQ